jgi:hypothetical protein
MGSAIAYIHPDKPLSLFINEVGVSQKRPCDRRRVSFEMARFSVAVPGQEVRPCTFSAVVRLISGYRRSALAVDQ